MPPLSCPLCCAADAYELPVAGKLYHRCRACELVWLDAAEHLDPAREKAVYDGHDNQVDDPRYRQFLQRAFGEVQRRLPGAAYLNVGHANLDSALLVAPNHALPDAPCEFLLVTERHNLEIREMRSLACEERNARIALFHIENDQPPAL